MKKSNMILIGMPGCGKSTCGVLIAKSLCKSFVDTDLLIQSREGSSLQAIIDQKGTAYFAKAEEEALLSFHDQNTVVSTGGSAVYYPSAMEHLGKDGIIVYLKVSFNVMMNRISNITTRGILLKPGETMEDMFHAREALYLKYADHTIDCDDLSIEEVVAKLYSITQ